LEAGPFSASAIDFPGPNGCTLQSDYHPLEAAFGYQSAFRSLEHKISPARGRDILEKAHQLDPENDAYVLKMAVLHPMPRARVRIATAAKTVARRSWRMENCRSRRRLKDYLAGGRMRMCIAGGIRASLGKFLI